MKHLSLFSGMGGFDLASEWSGWQNIAHCEWNPFCQQILKYYWPKAISYADITKTDFSIHRGNIDILTGGFPCQPYSTAGLRKGKDDERHLWPHMLRAIREVKPRWVVGENVLGLVGWNGGMVFEEVQAELEAEGYEVQPYILPAAAVNAPHRRDRVWFVAYCNSGSKGSSGKSGETESNRSENNDEPCSRRIEGEQYPRCCEFLRDITNTKSPCGWWKLFQRSRKRKSRRFNSKNQIATDSASFRQSGEKYREIESGWIAKESIPDDWTNFPTQSPVCNGDDGFSSRLDLTTIFKGFDKPLTFTKWRNESIKAGGNAIVPQVAFEIFKAIKEYDKIATS